MEGGPKALKSSVVEPLSFDPGHLHEVSEPVRATTQRNGGCDQRLHVDDSTIHQIDTLRIFPVTTTGSMK